MQDSRIGLLGALLLLCVGPGLGLAAFGAEASAEALVARFKDPQAFSKLCADIRRRSMEIDARHKSLEHTDISVNMELDRDGKPSTKEQVTEHIWFDETGQEHRLVVKKENLLTGADITPKKRTEVKPEKNTAIYPFSAEAPGNEYRYTLEGCETVGERLLLKVAFEPNKPVDKKFRGKIWADPETFDPIRFEGDWAEPPRFVNEMTHVLEFGPAENGQTQVRRSVVSGSGGFALIQKRFRIETDAKDFRARETK